MTLLRMAMMMIMMIKARWFTWRQPSNINGNISKSQCIQKMGGKKVQKIQAEEDNV